MFVDIIIKFGGSAVTVKDKLETLKDDELTNACCIVRNFLQHNKRIVIVHGAGSFGHHQAKQFNVNAGFTSEDTKLGFCMTRVSVTKLNNIIVNRLCQHGVNAVGIPAFGCWKTDNRKVIQHNIEIVNDVLANGFVPVLHGDCVFDTTSGCIILSGDTIIKTISKQNDVRNVIFFTDVDGIYDKSPQNKDAKLISDIAVEENRSISEDISTKRSNIDVTGGMELKIETAKDIVIDSQGRSTVFVCNVLSDPSTIFNTDSVFNGTIIRFKK
ncbi:uncharacterized protein LOC143065319 [Mytilus galloprovincialis]|uniref:uncharacterized protein LOC143065319 n=1 Tax=Mytilus galloprovincialis TaxID=29158 RepID=UPI003F7CB7B3